MQCQHHWHHSATATHTNQSNSNKSYIGLAIQIFIIRRISIFFQKLFHNLSFYVADIEVYANAVSMYNIFCTSDWLLAYYICVSLISPALLRFISFHIVAIVTGGDLCDELNERIMMMAMCTESADYVLVNKH